MAEMKVEDAEEITNTENDTKMMERQLAVVHDWNGIAHDHSKTTSNEGIPDGHAASTKKKGEVALAHAL
ncbi:hypothetical protein CEXT_243571 [Caerostris extrusa]|uniref:Uncharacterized protein n=1 Tax=Caerostris extrusa TaxID=172846 RepID=A0AAV4RTJ2_CAEEX|nr:hypothetical protein CEXT_243571 [Caerostris extrusa]